MSPLSGLAPPAILHTACHWFSLNGLLPVATMNLLVSMKLRIPSASSSNFLYKHKRRPPDKIF